jgi:hypothetical protein
MTTTDKLDDAINQVTIEMLKNLTHGEELELNSEYTLYRYVEDDIIVLVKSEDWEEVYQFLYNEEADEIIIEEL